MTASPFPATQPQEPAMTDPIAQYGQRGGPLPRYGSGSIATGFWRGYLHGARGADSTLQGRAIKAGVARAKAESGLEQHPFAPRRRA